MASNRMMQAIATLERAVSRLEQEADGLMSNAASQSPIVDPEAARAALRSLDGLIAELKGRADG
ncbi:hypothetical protein [Sphingobium mellinum]|uniref:hypothetical protein n=1 Tax=Sphingobium mellinum TaxID=1387166 RepID=UPI0030EC1EE4